MKRLTTGRFALAAAVMLLAVFLLVFVGGRGASVVAEMDASPVTTIVRVQVVRGGRVVDERVKVGDPMVRNMWHYIANAFLGRWSNSPLPMYLWNGTGITGAPEWGYVRWNDGTTSSNYYPWNTIRLGTSTTAVSFTDLNVRGSHIATFYVPSGGCSGADNGTHIIVTCAGSWVSTGSFTVGEILLSATTPSAGGCQPDYGWFYFVTRDVLSPTVSLSSGDTFTAVYTFAIRYSQPPFTRNLAVLIANYMTRLARDGSAFNFTTTDGTQTWTFDIGEDCNQSNRDCVREGLLFCATDYTGGYSPTLSSVPCRARAYIGLTDERVSPQAQVSYSYNSTHIWYTYRIDIPVTEPFMVRGIAVFLDPVDVDPTEGVNRKRLLILYFPVSQPFTVAPGQVVRFQFTITFRWA